MKDENQQLQQASTTAGATTTSCGGECGGCSDSRAEKDCGGAQHAVTAFDADKERTMLFVIYGLFLGGIVTGGITSIVAVIMLHVRKSEVVSSAWMTSHYDWGIKTFWYGLLGSFVSFVLSFIGIGIVLWLAVGVWYLYRLVRGLLGVVDRKTLPASLI